MRVLRTPGFAALLAGQAVNEIGNWVGLIAIWGFAAYRFDAGAGDLAVLMVVMSLPGTLLGPLLGVVIDRLGPRRSLLLANTLGCLTALALTQAGSYTQVILIALPLGLIESLAAAALDAMPPRLVGDDDLVSANALRGTADDLAVIVGPLVAAGVNLKWGIQGAFVADAATFAIAGVVALRLRVGDADADDSAEVEDPATVWSELCEGFSLARRTQALRWALAVAAATFLLWSVFAILEPLYFRDVLGLSDTWFAVSQSVFGAGLVSAGLAVTAMGERLARPRYLALALAFSGVTAAVYTGTGSVTVAFVAVFLWGVDVAFFLAPLKTLLQRHSPMRAHGRILSFNQSLECAASVVATPLAAAAVVATSVSVVGVGGGAAAMVAGLVALRTAPTARPSESVEVTSV